MEIEILTDDGFSKYHTIRRKKSDKLKKIHFADGTDIVATYDHMFFISDNEILVEDIVVGDTLDPNKKVSSIEEISNEQWVYDVVETDNHKFMANGIVSHNCRFLGSSGTLISGEVLKNLVIKEPLIQKEGISQYVAPIKDHVYSMICDVSRGKGLDYSAFSIIDATTMPYKQVCTFRDNFVGPIDYASIIYRIAKLYNNAHLLIEINDIGGQVADTLFMDFGYENILFTENAGRSGKRISGGFGKNVDKGIRTSKSVKSVGCSILKMLIEQNQLEVNDFETIQELSRFSKKGSSFEAESGYHDDLVMTLVLFAWLVDQSYFKEVTDINTLMNLREKTDEQMNDDMLPFGFIMDGTESTEQAIPRYREWMDF